MIIQNLAVCPPQVRPSVSVDSSLRSQDDLTHQYNQILKSNEALKNFQNSNANESTYQSKFENLQFNVATLMNNDLSYGRAQKKSGQPIKAIYARLKGKEGRVRGNLMGKRVDFSARSVISPDPNLQVDELGVPLSIAMNLTFPEPSAVNVSPSACPSRCCLPTMGASISADTISPFVLRLIVPSLRPMGTSTLILYVPSSIFVSYSLQFCREGASSFLYLGEIQICHLEYGIVHRLIRFRLIVASLSRVCSNITHHPGASLETCALWPAP